MPWRDAQVRRVRRNEVIYRKGDACDGFFVVVFGTIRSSLFSSDGAEKPIQIAGSSNTFGEATMFQELDHYTTAIAAEDSALLFIPKVSITEQLLSNPRLAMRMLANLSYRLHMMVDDIDDFLLQPPPARVASYLLRLIPHDSPAARNVHLVLKKRLMAAQLNLQPETLSRHFRRMNDLGLVSIKGHTVTIHRVESLRQFVSANAHGPGRHASPESDPLHFDEGRELGDTLGASVGIDSLDSNHRTRHC